MVHGSNSADNYFDVYDKVKAKDALGNALYQSEKPFILIYCDCSESRNNPLNLGADGQIPDKSDEKNSAEETVFQSFNKYSGGDDQIHNMTLLKSKSGLTITIRIPGNKNPSENDRENREDLNFVRSTESIFSESEIKETSPQNNNSISSTISAKELKKRCFFISCSAKKLSCGKQNLYNVMNGNCTCICEDLHKAKNLPSLTPLAKKNVVEDLKTELINTMKNNPGENCDCTGNGRCVIDNLLEPTDNLDRQSSKHQSPHNSATSNSYYPNSCYPDSYYPDSCFPNSYYPNSYNSQNNCWNVSSPYEIRNECYSTNFCNSYPNGANQSPNAPFSYPEMQLNGFPANCYQMPANWPPYFTADNYSIGGTCLCNSRPNTNASSDPNAQKCNVRLCNCRQKNSQQQSTNRTGCWCSDMRHCSESTRCNCKSTIDTHKCACKCCHAPENTIVTTTEFESNVEAPEKDSEEFIQNLVDLISSQDDILQNISGSTTSISEAEQSVTSSSDMKNSSTNNVKSKHHNYEQKSKNEKLKSEDEDSSTQSECKYPERTHVINSSVQQKICEYPWKSEKDSISSNATQRSSDCFCVKNTVQNSKQGNPQCKNVTRIISGMERPLKDLCHISEKKHRDLKCLDDKTDISSPDISHDILAKYKKNLKRDITNIDDSYKCMKKLPISKEKSRNCLMEDYTDKKLLKRVQKCDKSTECSTTSTNSKSNSGNIDILGNNILRKVECYNLKNANSDDLVERNRNLHCHSQEDYPSCEKRRNCTNKIKNTIKEERADQTNVAKHVKKSNSIGRLESIWKYRDIASTAKSSCCTCRMKHCRDKTLTERSQHSNIKLVKPKVVEGSQSQRCLLKQHSISSNNCKINSRACLKKSLLWD